MSTVTISCPACGAKVRVKGDPAGKSLRCPRCKEPLKIPDSPGATAQPSPRPIATPSTKAQEVTFYSDDKGVRITNARAILGSRTYSMANVTSVAMRGKPVQVKGCLILIAFFFGSFTLMGIVAAFSEGGGGGGIACAAFSAALGGILAYLVTQWKPEYTVWINGAGGEANALTSSDKDYIERIIDALNKAIVHRG